MHHLKSITCIHCSSSNLVKNGHSENNTQRWHCNDCKKNFQLDYRYNARRPGIKEKIYELTLNSSGVRDIGRILKISKNTVITELKKNTKNQSLSVNYSGIWTTWTLGHIYWLCSRDGWVLELCSKENQSAMDLVSYGKTNWNDRFLAQWKKNNAGFKYTA